MSMIERQDRSFDAGGRRKGGDGGNGHADIQARGRKFSNHRRDYEFIFFPQISAFAGVRIQAADNNFRILYTESRA